MKIKINYDLLTRISEAKVGMSLNKTFKEISVYTSFVAALNMFFGDTPQELLEDTIFTFFIYSIYFSLRDLALLSLNKNNAIKDLRYLSQLLQSINVNTSYDLLLNSYKYETNYEFENEKSFFPKLIQKKYIMVPVYDNGEEKEVSIVQEHVVGTREYSLACGSPNKAYKLVPSAASL